MKCNESINNVKTSSKKSKITMQTINRDIYTWYENTNRKYSYNNMYTMYDEDRFLMRLVWNKACVRKKNSILFITLYKYI